MFTKQELRQIVVMTQDIQAYMDVFARNIPSLSLVQFKADMLGIAMKCERELLKIAEEEKAASVTPQR